MESVKLDYEQYKKVARQTAAESCVLLKNDNRTLPLRAESKVAVFGIHAFYYYKSGLGSGGLVNTEYAVSILDALKREEILINESLLKIYEEWIGQHPFEEGYGWGTVPWTQKEMPVSGQLIRSVKKESDAAVVIIGRTAGEDQDHKAKKGSFLLTDEEEKMLSGVCEVFEKTIVLLNVGNIIDMSWVERYHPAAVMYVWQGGQEGGNGVADILMGRTAPCGKLVDTIAQDIADYPSTGYFGDLQKNYYTEDIYVGYRYFESCAKEKVLYPFGYGLSYTEFKISDIRVNICETQVCAEVSVTNTGSMCGKEVVQVYIEAPEGNLGKPLRVLAGFKKTDELKPGQMQILKIECPKTYFASFDDSGITGYKSALLLEAGEYRAYVGANVRQAKYVQSWVQGIEILEQLSEACAPKECFERYRIYRNADGKSEIKMEPVPTGTIEAGRRMEQNEPEEIAYTGDQGLMFRDVYDGKITLEQFIGQLSVEELAMLMRGEGMYSSKATPGNASVFGGLNKLLSRFGIPVACCADGPSGIRMDCGTKAFSLPNGTAIGCTFNTELAEELYGLFGSEIWLNQIDIILGPGMNIHRNPLNGRNFEYVSEDPLLTGKMCAAMLKGLHQVGISGTVKHFCANNQESSRTTAEAVISQRALREIYLKGFEIAVKEGDAESIMTTYGPVNGTRTAGSFDLCTVILRKEWGFRGLVMTDWWAKADWNGEIPEDTVRAPMVRAQNDLFMCCEDTAGENKKDDILAEVQSGRITRAQLQRNAKNILGFLLKSLAMKRELGLIDRNAFRGYGQDVAEAEGEAIEITNCKDGGYVIEITALSKTGELAQIPVSVFVDQVYRGTIAVRGTSGQKKIIKMILGNMQGETHAVKLVYRKNEVTVSNTNIYHMDL